MSITSSENRALSNISSKPGHSTLTSTPHAGGASPKHVIIVGAGFAGLAAAQKLSKSASQSLQVTVLEGGARLGGRAWTHTLPDLGKTEFGATYVPATDLLNASLYLLYWIFLEYCSDRNSQLKLVSAAAKLHTMRCLPGFLHSTFLRVQVSPWHSGPPCLQACLRSRPFGPCPHER